MNRNRTDQLTVNDLLSLFGRSAEDSHRVALADADEFLALVTYLSQPSGDSRALR